MLGAVFLMLREVTVENIIIEYGVPGADLIAFVRLCLLCSNLLLLALDECREVTLN